VVRGGSWHFGPDFVRAANRHRDAPSSRSPWCGFRCAWSPPPNPIEAAELGVVPDGGPTTTPGPTSSATVRRPGGRGPPAPALPIAGDATSYGAPPGLDAGDDGGEPSP
jgi:hypothetical protein